jgi:large subunit ribosomal protein L25
VLTLNIGGRPQLALTKTVVTHPIRPYIEHVDLVVITRGEMVGVEVQVVVTGDAALDTLVTQELNTIEVEADVSSIPEQIEVSVEGLPAGTQIHASDVPLPEGTTLRTDAEILVVNVVQAPTAAQVEASLETEGAGVVEEAATASDEG